MRIKKKKKIKTLRLARKYSNGFEIRMWNDGLAAHASLDCFARALGRHIYCFLAGDCIRAPAGFRKAVPNSKYCRVINQYILENYRTQDLCVLLLTEVVMRQ